LSIYGGINIYHYAHKHCIHTNIVDYYDHGNAILGILTLTEEHYQTISF